MLCGSLRYTKARVTPVAKKNRSFHGNGLELSWMYMNVAVLDVF
jgi:hypothetical protein